MKYVMFETTNGQKIPVIFPESLAHATMAMVVAAAIEVSTKSMAEAVSGGFINLGLDVGVHGKSESLGLESNPDDAARILLGESVSFMPDNVVAMMAEKLKEMKT
jgi:hypothetical protein